MMDERLRSGSDRGPGPGTGVLRRGASDLRGRSAKSRQRAKADGRVRRGTGWGEYGLMSGSFSTWEAWVAWEAFVLRCAGGLEFLTRKVLFEKRRFAETFEMVF